MSEASKVSAESTARAVSSAASPAAAAAAAPAAGCSKCSSSLYTPSVSRFQASTKAFASPYAARRC
ncbi:hypothetical protein Emed_001589 [Eimeria media]